jgi:hypothetical protein
MRAPDALSPTQWDPQVPAPRRGFPAVGPTVDVQLRRLETRLLAEADGDRDLEQTLRGHLAHARAHFASATVRQFLPILIEREVRRLAAQ